MAKRPFDLTVAALALAWLWPLRRYHLDEHDVQLVAAALSKILVQA